ncbi:delta9-fatty acid desaturase [Thelephora ganbajun]|uniref:Delta9-fatty acid desaturase n=1 Tax=Thelephora ganbajun TaxID=370292 RepID=A0ACB6Z705_THEGA|nr:delta9-fatty acid desaturase [Thelephora ganbajun]
MGVVSRPSGVVQDDSRAQPKLAPAPSKPITTSGIPDSDKYVDRLLRNAEPLPPITWSNWYKEVRWFNLSVIVITPLVSLYGALTTHLEMRTFWFCVFYYVFNMIGITAGYHRLWSHRAYNASKPLEYFLAVAGGGSVQGAIWWWARGHRSHHRYTDTDLDPYNAERGFWWSHVVWMLVKPRIKPGPADISDLRKNAVVQWQYRNYLAIALIWGFIVPAVIPGYFWGDWRGGYFYAGFFRIVTVHHSTFAVNSLAHWLGESTFDDKHTPRDHLVTAFLTLGEGYHNFHHQFPMDYRNAVKWYQWDPTKWFIAVCNKLGLASHLRIFPGGEIDKGRLTMQLRRLKAKQDTLEWPMDSNDLPVINWESFREQSKTRPLVLIGGFIHDLSSFMNQHPGGRGLLSSNTGKDATTAFLGGVYEHSHAAHNLLAMMRVGVLLGGFEHVPEIDIPPAQRLRVVDFGG